ncbi:MAG TPA: serine hydrolase, partial [Cellvibrionaceae bacterium]|nr:serine hydrolase [Cellvibrionaceae bacterium]
MTIKAINFEDKALKRRLLNLLTFSSAMLMGQAAMAKCEFTVTTSWTGGYQASLKITGEPQPVANWNAIWQFAPGTSINGAPWGDAKVTGTNPYTASSINSTNTTLSTSAQLTVYMNVNGTDKNPKLSGNACGWLNKDIGAVGVSGSATVGTDNKITLKASGNDIGNDVDAFHFYYTTLQGDGEVTGYVEPGVVGPSDWTKVGVMFRGDLDANAENYAFVLRPQFGSQSQFRPSKNAGYTDASERLWVQNQEINDMFFGTKHHINYVDKYPTPYRAHFLQPGKWLKAVRTGSSVLTYSSDDGKCWNLRSRNDNAAFGQQAFAGFVLSSHVSNQLATAKISNVSKNQTPQADVNWDCARAKVDGDIAPPQLADWIVKPGVFGGDYWSISYTNPNPVQRPATCRSKYGWDERRFTDDSTICPAEITQAPWTRTGYSLTGIWQTLPGGFGEKGLGRAAYTSTPFNKKEFWLRKEIQLTSSDFNKIVFWGRWNNSASIYVNGVLATNVYSSNMGDAYHYLGLRDEARSALINGTNVVTAHIECANCDSAFADFGVGRNAKLGQFYLRNQMTDSTSPNYNPNYNPNSKSAKLTKVFADDVKEKALLGGSIAVRQNGALVESLAIGYRDRTLNENMPKEPILRLASVDKSPTRAAIRKVIELGTSLTKNPAYTGPYPITPNTKVFGPGGILSDITPVGGVLGTNVEKITVAHLHDHISGINDNGRDEQAWEDLLAYQYGIPASQVTAKQLIGYWISQPTIATPGQDNPGSHYSSGG